ncbi:hypothetical protein AXF42_Ash002785 [Apostasia shenzhenica]|uniref:Uncharacterized protein n=1 Tax=Apostasia shenzhenica TaxID=1088818 RepID=A0A2I0A7A0_9ASPA|nr:hypothetical protein AXF42_Ash002785 [Apostasia shenzhenica]
MLGIVDYNKVAGADDLALHQSSPALKNLTPSKIVAGPPLVSSDEDVSAHHR